jgi:hypothetical protein
MKRLPVFFIIVICFGVCQSCSDDNSTKKTEPSAVIGLASPAQLERIQIALDGDRVYVEKAYATKSKDFQRVWFVAAKIHGPGMGTGEVGVWAMTGEKADPGIVQSVNGIAKNFSVYPYGPDTKSGVSMTDQGANEVKRHAEMN